MGDYFTFTALRYRNNWQMVVRNFLRMNPDLFTDVGYGGNGGYKKCVAYGGIRVYYEGREEVNEYEQTDYPMGVCVSMSGTGCRIFEDNCETWQLIDLFEFLIPYEDDGAVNFTRLDIAADDKEGILDMDTMLLYIVKRKLNCKFDKARMLQDIDLREEQNGMTLYLGSQNSDFRFRIYDKAAEQKLTDGTHWIRVEMVCRDEYASGAIRQLVANRDRLGECVAGMILKRLTFIELDRTRRTNCSVAEWWANFLQTVEEIEFFFKEKPERTADKLHDWILWQLAASLATAKEIFGARFIMYVLKEGRKKLTPHQRALIRDYCPLGYDFV
jgi:phage replication initiation protein